MEGNAVLQRSQTLVVFCVVPWALGLESPSGMSASRWSKRDKQKTLNCFDGCSLGFGYHVRIGKAVLDLENKG